MRNLLINNIVIKMVINLVILYNKIIKYPVYFYNDYSFENWYK